MIRVHYGMKRVQNQIFSRYNQMVRAQNEMIQRYNPMKITHNQIRNQITQ